MFAALIHFAHHGARPESMYPHDRTSTDGRVAVEPVFLKRNESTAIVPLKPCRAETALAVPIFLAKCLRSLHPKMLPPNFGSREDRELKDRRFSRSPAGFPRARHWFVSGVGKQRSEAQEKNYPYQFLVSGTRIADAETSGWLLVADADLLLPKRTVTSIFQVVPMVLE